MSKKLWGGRFKKQADPFFEEFSSSIMTDYRLAKCDLIGSIIHVHVLFGAKLLTASEFTRFKKAILSCLALVKKGEFPYDFSSEDIHTNIHQVLTKKIGKLAEKLQTCRSRNDQVVFDTKLYCMISGVQLQDLLAGVRNSLYALAKKYNGLVVPGYTHLQHAQPVLFKDYLGAYAMMFKNDALRLEDALNRLDISLGSGALAGTPISAGVYKVQIKKALKSLKLGGLADIVTPSSNSLAAVSDRDFVIEILSVLAVIGMHISRLAEDFILWSSQEFGFAEIGDEYCTGSSLMPQKKNPDALELMRGHTGTLQGYLVSVLTTMKGLPLSYNRDMQLDKKPLFGAISLVEDELVILAGLLATVRMNKKNIDVQLADDSLYATDLADYLVSGGVSFAQAHEVIGQLIRYSHETGRAVKELTQDELNQFCTKLKRKEVLKRLDPHFCVASKKSVIRN
ncbi:MAG: argininosuccinate lyase [Candidatus Omnitrophota bacterium]